ncbi:MAG: SIMPL domain-containing protein [Candidatus Nealsonbacteria bacterium]
MNTDYIKHPEIKDKKKLLNIFLIVLILFVGMLTINEFKKGKYIGQDVQSTISVSAIGEVYAKPDLALISFSVVSEEKAAADALTKNSESMNKIIEFLKNSGVEDKDLKTTTFRISPRYEWRNGSEFSYPPVGQRVLVGYEVTQSLEVKIRDMLKIGTLIEGATDAGATGVGSLEFTFDDEDELKKQAREIAIDKAKLKAKELTQQLGVGLGRITNFSESAVSPIFYGLKEAYGLGGAAPEIETGENLIQSTVIITYEIH